jgi:hypothetical protein
MKPNEIEDIESCNKCGIVFNIYAVEKKEKEYDYEAGRNYICPLCKHENYIER